MDTQNKYEDVAVTIKERIKKILEYKRQETGTRLDQLAKHVNTRAQGRDKFETHSFNDAQDKTKTTVIL